MAEALLPIDYTEEDVKSLFEHENFGSWDEVLFYLKNIANVDDEILTTEKVALMLADFGRLANQLIEFMPDPAQAYVLAKQYRERHEE